MATARNRPTKNQDGSSIVTPSRTYNYGEAAIVPYGVGRYGLADEGSYWSASRVILNSSCRRSSGSTDRGP